jgi:hypothetical protein
MVLFATDTEPFKLFGLHSETLVQLANVGCAGVAILGIFLSAYLVWSLPEDANKAKADLVRSFMRTCVFLALIAGASAGWLGYYNSKKVEVAEVKATTAEVRAHEAELQVVATQGALVEAQKVTVAATELLNGPTTVSLQQPDKALKLKKAVEKFELLNPTQMAVGSAK